MSDKKISVIMGMYNEPEDWIRESVESILHQTYKNIELIIVLDNPKNETLKRIAESYAVMDDRIRIISNDSNIGLPKSLNKAISIADGEYIARMDADDISLPDRLEKELAFIENNQLDFVASNMMKFRDCKNLGIVNKQPRSNFFIKLRLRYQNCLPHPTWLVRREVYDKLNGYRLIPTEDYDFLLRARIMDIRFGVINEVLLKYRMRESSISHTKRVLQNTTYWFLVKNANKISDMDIVKYLESKSAAKAMKDVERYYKLTDLKFVYQNEGKRLKAFAIWILRCFTTKRWLRGTICSEIIPAILYRLEMLCRFKYDH